jgi:LacI family transcriptional regulator
MKKKVSIKDVAQAVGVSTALVSYVLNNKEKEARVGKEIAQVIRDTARKLDYQPNQIAKSLKSGKSQTIGLIVADISNPFFANLARTIEDEAKKDNYTVIFGSSDENADKSWDLINVLIKRQVDGFIIAPTEKSEEQIKYLVDQNVPFVLIDRYFPEIDTNYVTTDNYQASYEAVGHLIKTGHRNIGLIVYDSQLVHMKERTRGYLDALKDNNLLTDVSLIRKVNFNNLKEDIENKINELLYSKPSIDSLFFATNTLALNGLKFLFKHNYRIPDDLAVVCFDEGDAFDFFYSPLTFVDQPLVEVGKEAVRILVDEMKNNKNSKRQIAISSKLVVGKSSGA